MRITRTQTYSALAGVGILLGAAGLASAATATSTDPSAPPATALAAGPDDAEGDEVDGPEQGEGAAQDGADGADEQDGSTYTSSITVADLGEAPSGADEQTRLAGLATITADDAGRAALSTRSGTVSDIHLENENGSVVYSVRVDTGNGTVDVKVDAGTAGVLAVDSADGDGERHGFDAEHGETNEAPGTEVLDD